MATRDDLTDRLRAALSAARSPWAEAPLETLRDKGLAHDHVRLHGSGLLARIPKQSQIGLGAAANLAYQQACFERAAAGGHTPQLHGMLPPTDALPRGALLVQEIEGQPASLPVHLGEIARTLASLHRLPVPPAHGRAPLLDARDPLDALCKEVTAQATHLPAAHLQPAVAQTIADEMDALQRLCAGSERPEKRLIAFDGHPGNFIIDARGRAMLVDLEKCRYSYPGLDLAHATLYTSTTWDIDTSAVLTPADVLSCQAAWEQAVGPDTAKAARPWQVPLRRAMWLWSVTWCAKWRASSGQAARPTADGEDWSTERSEASLVAHVRGRVDHYLGTQVVEQIQDEFDVLDAALRA